jgi:hypothetical protein
MSYHVQCTLSKEGTKQVAWIEERLAVEGSTVGIKRRGTEEWDEGWLVEEAHPGARRPSDVVMARERDHLTQRRASDI